MTEPASVCRPLLDRRKFRDPFVTARGEPRAQVRLGALQTLWFNTGTLCNLACRHCYIESSPTEDRLAWLTAAEVGEYLDEIERERLGTRTVGFTGGEPFMNPQLLEMMRDALERGLEVLVLTNAMRPMARRQAALLRLQRQFGARLTVRVSVDHYTAAVHELERGARSWRPTLDGLQWLAREGFNAHVATRCLSGEPEAVLRAGFARLFAEHGIGIDAHDAVALMVFPEMDVRVDVPEITEACWSILSKSPDDVMCASSRMVVRRRGEPRCAVVACTLLPDDAQFELGATLAEAAGPVQLNHPHCARFCVLGGAACKA